MTTWFIAYTDPRMETTAAHRLRLAGYRAFAPYYFERRSPLPDAPAFMRMAFPRYVFLGTIEANDHPFRAKACVGVSRRSPLLMSDDKAAIVAPKFMDALMERCEPDGWMRELDNKPRPKRIALGTPVMLVDNLMSGIIQQVAELDGQDIYDVEIEMFGAKRVAKVPASGIARHA